MLLISAIFFACCYVKSWASPGLFFFKQTSVTACRLKWNNYSKVGIALCALQFWSEIKRVITKSNDCAAD